MEMLVVLCVALTASTPNSLWSTRLIAEAGKLKRTFLRFS